MFELNLNMYHATAIAALVLLLGRWIIKKYKGLSPAELLQAPVDALYGVSAGDAELLQEAFGIKTIGDLADNKFFAWAAEIAGQAKEE